MKSNDQQTKGTSPSYAGRPGGPGAEYLQGASFECVSTKVIEISHTALSANRLEAFFDDSPTADFYKVLRTRILQKTEHEGWNTLLVTSPLGSEGKSLTAANLAISLAKEMEHTVLLVDADLRNPSLHRLFGIDLSNGLMECLLYQKPLCDVLVNPGPNKLTMLLNHRSIPDSTEVMGSPAMKALIKDVKHRYQDRYIIFDAPPVVGPADTLILSQYVDGVILVVEYGKTQKSQIKKAMKLLENTNMLGTVLNKAPRPKKKSNRYTSGTLK
jgi:exopolysaccharide/PEP-CTERM locus tyrosine autokinase